MTGQYSRITPQLAIQRAIMPYFGKYKSAPVVEKLLNRCDEFQEDLLNDIMAEFDVSFGKCDADMLHHLAESAKLMAAMGDGTTEDLTRWYCEKELGRFSQEEPQNCADLVAKCEMLAENLDSFDVSYLEVFPPEWEISKRFTKDCCTWLRGTIDTVVSAPQPAQ